MSVLQHKYGEEGQERMTLDNFFEPQVVKKPESIYVEENCAGCGKKIPYDQPKYRLRIKGKENPYCQPCARILLPKRPEEKKEDKQ